MTSGRQLAELLHPLFHVLNSFLPFLGCINGAPAAVIARKRLQSFVTLHYARGEGEEGAGFFPLFPMCVFPSGSPSSQLVPQDILNSTPVLSHMVCPKFNCLMYKVKRWAIGSIFVFIIWMVVPRGASIGTRSMFFKKMMMGQSIPLQKKKENVRTLLAMVLMQLGCSSLLGSCLPNYMQNHVSQ